MYVSTDIPDQCGAITMPTARSIPSARISATVSAMNGGECFMPRYARNGAVAVAFSSATSPSACARVMSSSGNRLPIAA